MASSLLYGEGIPSEYVSLTPREAASGIFGSVSLTCWIFLLVPQLIENYRYGSSDGLSMAFLVVWFVGDVANLVGGLWAQLVPVVVAIAVYFCIADGVLIAQSTYYKIRNARRAQRRSSHQSSIEPPTPTTPLLGRRFSDELSITGSRRRRSSASLRGNQRGINPPDDPLAKIVEEGDFGARVWIKNVLSVAGIFVVGAGGWAIAWQSGLWKPTPLRDGGSTQMAAGAQVLGYFSAVCYLGARLPQIYKNYNEKSCEGLSLLFFILSLLGNLSYGVGILAHSTQRDYFLTNLPWLIGSLGTMVEDIAIFVQFRIYARPALS